jgi:hypothetical protein
MRSSSQISLRPRSPEIFDITGDSLKSLISSDLAGPVRDYFTDYPPRSFMSNRSRVVLYELVRALNATSVAEVGTLFAGTSEVIARALYDNGGGKIYTTDPYGNLNGCPEIIAKWPPELSELCEFVPKNSMEFFLMLEQRKLSLDLTLVDGNHDFEFALYDLYMAAKLTRPGGVIVMDNAEQTGPFYATRQFLQENLGWKEIGNALGQYSRSYPFDKNRSSIPNTTFLILQKPREYLIYSIPSSTSQVEVDRDKVIGISLKIAKQTPKNGNLHIQVILRSFINEPREIEEYFYIVKIPIRTDGEQENIEFIFDEPVVSILRKRDSLCKNTLELEFSWEGAEGEALALMKPPIPL